MHLPIIFGQKRKMFSLVSSRVGETEFRLGLLLRTIPLVPVYDASFCNGSATFCFFPLPDMLYDCSLTGRCTESKPLKHTTLSSWNACCAKRRIAKGPRLYRINRRDGIFESAVKTETMRQGGESVDVVNLVVELHSRGTVSKSQFRKHFPAFVQTSTSKETRNHLVLHRLFREGKLIRTLFKINLRFLCLIAKFRSLNPSSQGYHRVKLE